MMKNKGWIMILVLIWEYILIIMVESIGATSSGGVLLSIPTDPTFLEYVGTFFDIFVGLLTFSITIDNAPVILIFGAVYLPLLILFVAVAMMIRRD